MRGGAGRQDLLVLSAADVDAAQAADPARGLTVVERRRLTNLIVMPSLPSPTPTPSSCWSQRR